MRHHSDMDNWTEVRYRRGRRDFNQHPRPERHASRPQRRHRGEPRHRSSSDRGRGTAQTRERRTYAEIVAGARHSAPHNNGHFDHDDDFDTDYDNEDYYEPCYYDDHWNNYDDFSNDWREGPPARPRRPRSRGPDDGRASRGTPQRRRRHNNSHRSGGRDWEQNDQRFRDGNHSFRPGNPQNGQHYRDGNHSFQPDNRRNNRRLNNRQNDRRFRADGRSSRPNNRQNNRRFRGDDRPFPSGNQRSRPTGGRGGDGGAASSHTRHQHDTQQHHNDQNEENDFRKKVRIIHTGIKIAHHLKNVFDLNNPPANIIKMQNTLISFIKPASNNDETRVKIEGNAKNWAYTSAVILKEHYAEALENNIDLLETLHWGDLMGPFQVAVTWAKRNLGRRLRQHTIDHMYDILEARLININSDPDHTDTEPPAQQTAEIRYIDTHTQHTTYNSVGTQSVVELPPPGPTEGDGNLIVLDAVPTTDPAPKPKRSRRMVTFGTQTEVIPDSLLDRAAAVPPHPQSTSPHPGTCSSSAEKHSTPLTAAERHPVAAPEPTPPSSARDLSVNQLKGILDVETPIGIKLHHGISLGPRRVTRSATAQVNADTAAPAQVITTRPSSICKPRRHKTTNNKLQEWSYEVKGQFLIIGDSNISNCPEVDNAQLQMDSYPGATFMHAHALLSKVPVNLAVHTVILSFGINDRKTDPCMGPTIEMEDALESACTVFPKARVLIPMINYSSSLSPEEQENLACMNDYITKNSVYIPALPASKFVTGVDGIHWDTRTGSNMLSHWFEHLNSSSPRA